MMKNLLGIRFCTNCGKEIEIFHRCRLSLKNVYCSKECENEYKKKEREYKEGYLNCECPICKKLFHLKPYQIKKYKHNYCSKECFNESKKETMKGENNHQYGLKGKLNASWKSDEKISHYGYKQIRVLDHPFRNNEDFVMEHRLVAEKYLLNDENSIEVNGKKYLKPEYVVHHKDFNKLNNDVNNLEVMTLAEHTSLHAKTRNIKGVNKYDINGNFIKSYDSIKDAGYFNNIKPQNISKVCKNKKHSAGGYIWRYKTRGFEKVSRLSNIEVTLPRRATIGSAGYDFFLYEDVEIKPGINKISSGIKSYMENDVYLMIVIRSSLAYKYGLTLANSVAIIDASFYNSDSNEGEICFLINNISNETYKFKAGDRIAQGIFMKFFLTSDDNVKKLRIGGFGSTGN